jgi:hypothetical protein
LRPAGAAELAYDAPILTGRGAHMGEFAMELWAFMKERKKFWLLPMIVVLLFFGMLIVMTQGSAVAPFIYTLF